MAPPALGASLRSLHKTHHVGDRILTKLDLVPLLLCDAQLMTSYDINNHSEVY